MRREEKDEIRSYSVETIIKEQIPACVKTIAKERRKLTLDRIAGKTTNQSLMVKNKKKLAVLKTILREKELDAAFQFAATALGL